MNLTTPLIIRSKVDVSCLMVLDHARWLGPKQNTRNIYFRADEKRCNQVHSIMLVQAVFIYEKTSSGLHSFILLHGLCGYLFFLLIGHFHFV